MSEQIEVIISGVAVIVGALVVILQKMGFVFNGKKSAHQATKVELQIGKLKKEIYSDINNETDKAHETHAKIFEKLEELSNTVSYIKGMLDNKANQN